MTEITSVVVECDPNGSCSYARCTADVFEPGILTITALDADADYPPVREFARGTWITATVSDAQGYMLFQILSERGKREAIERLVAAQAFVAQVRQAIQVGRAS